MSIQHGQLASYRRVFGLGDGSQVPVLIGSDTGGGNDEVLPTDTAISVSFSGAKAGGAIRLDNFQFRTETMQCTATKAFCESSQRFADYRMYRKGCAVVLSLNS